MMSLKPLAERRAQALSIDQAQLRELLGEAELRELLDADALAEVEQQLQQLGDTRRVRTMDGVHDLLLRLGDLALEEIAARSLTDAAEAIALQGRSGAIDQLGGQKQDFSARPIKRDDAGQPGSFFAVVPIVAEDRLA